MKLITWTPLIFSSFLGTTIESQLKLGYACKLCIIENIENCCILYRLRSEFPTYILKSNYNTLLLPHLTYCILSRFTGITNWQNTLLAKKELYSNVTKSAYNGHIESLCKEHNILKVHGLYRLSILKFYFKLLNNNLPHYFNSFTPQFSLGHIYMHYNLQNPLRQLPIINTTMYA